MQLFTAEQIREWDAYTIQREPVSSVQLMNRAANACADWIKKEFTTQQPFLILAGSGNNGGDGLAIARILQKAGYQVTVCAIATGRKSSPDCLHQLKLLPKSIRVQMIAHIDHFPEMNAGLVVLDAILGTGASRPLKGTIAKLVQQINQSKATIISIDIPSGMPADWQPLKGAIVTATHTLSFQVPKLSFFLPGAAEYTGKISILEIGLHPFFLSMQSPVWQLADWALMQQWHIRRPKEMHKYQAGSVLLYAGSKEMMGAGILCATATLRSGAGLVTVHAAPEQFSTLNIVLPEAIVTNQPPALAWRKKSVIAFGPGLALSASNKTLLKKLVQQWPGPLVIDASGIGMLAPYLPLLQKRPASAPVIITPHTGELQQLFGESDNATTLQQMAVQMARKHQMYIVLKGRYTVVATPNGAVMINSTGNPGMATAGSGDVLTGIIAGLLATGYDAFKACSMGVYLHGLAGDKAVAASAEEAIIASDLIGNLGKAFADITT